MAESSPGVADYERLISAYKGAVILYYDGASDERATEMRRCRAALDAYVEGLEDTNEQLRVALDELLADYLTHMQENAYTEMARSALDAARKEEAENERLRASRLASIERSVERWEKALGITPPEDDELNAGQFQVAYEARARIPRPAPGLY
jgi:hypothetical protein